MKNIVNNKIMPLTRSAEVSDESCGVLYIAFGDKYIKEARLSIESLKKHSPNINVAVVTNVEWVDGGNVNAILCEPIYSLASKPAYIVKSPFCRTLYLDTDTYICRDLTPIFGLLNYYDCCGQFMGNPINEANGLEFQPRIHSGAFLFKRSPKVTDMLAHWQFLYSEHVDKTKDTVDEVPLTRAIAESPVKIGALGMFFHVGLHAPWVFFSPPVVVHGRVRNIQCVVREITKNWDASRDWGARVWLPSLQGVLPRGVRRSDPLLALAFVMRRFWNEAKQFAYSILNK